MGFKIIRDAIRVDTVNGQIVQKKVKRSLDARCKKCGTDTRSHYYDDGSFMCHKCWLKEEDKKAQAKTVAQAQTQEAVKTVAEGIKISPEPPADKHDNHDD